MAADKGYDVPRIRDWLRRRRITAIIPEKHKPHGRKPGRPLVFDADIYRRRNVIERSISWLKHARRIASVPGLALRDDRWGLPRWCPSRRSTVACTSP